MLTFLFYRALFDRKEPMGSRLVLAGVLATTMGLVTELLQHDVPGRFPSLIDVLLNTGGVLLSVTLLYWLRLKGVTPIEAGRVPKGS